jgi:hypothetical protein
VRSNRLRYELIAVLAVAAIVSGIGNAVHQPLVGWAGFAVFLCALVMYARWRRVAMAERRGRVFDSEAETDETRTRPDQ